MIDIAFTRGPSGFTGFEVRGHSGLEAAGRDIVCAAVSAVAQAAVMGLKEAVGCPVDADIDSGYLRCIVDEGRMGSGTRREAQAVIKTALVALEDISEQYPERVRVTVICGR